MGLVDYARGELQRAGLFDKDSDYGGMLGDATLRTVEAFANEDHSGFSASISLQLLRRLLRYKPLTAIQRPEEGEYEEIEGGDDNTFQHKRDYNLFSHDGGKTWYALDSNERSWWKPWTWLRNGRRRVRFPYMPS